MDRSPLLHRVSGVLSELPFCNGYDGTKLWGVSHSFVTDLFSSNDDKKAEHSFVRGGRTCDEPLNMVSQGLSEGINGTSETSFFDSSFGSSP